MLKKISKEKKKEVEEKLKKELEEVKKEIEEEEEVLDIEEEEVPDIEPKEESKVLQVPVFLTEADKSKMIYETHAMVSQILRSLETVEAAESSE